MLADRSTLTQFLIEERRRHPYASGDLNALILDVALACKAIAKRVAYGALGGVLGASGAVNVQGETQQRLDAWLTTNYSGEQWAAILTAWCPRNRATRSAIPAQYPRGKYLLVFDPLDGSSKIDVNVCVGSIFSIFRAPAPARTPRQRISCTGIAADLRGLCDLRAVYDARDHCRHGCVRIHARSADRRVLPDPSGDPDPGRDQRVRDQRFKQPVLGAGGEALRR